ncbi:MAG: sigma-70 family RNA polymerase sigma factor [Clostridiales bacterium]|nr:sigma-70 family RNA polymerase sigma factor [Clostridiales bacterium]
MAECYMNATDETLIREIRLGVSTAQDCLITRYKSLVKAKAGLYHLSSADRDDMIQEGMIGLFRAIQDYDPERQVLFKTFAELCVNRQMISALRSATRQKHIPLNTSLPFNQNSYQEESRHSRESDNQRSPEEMFIDRETQTYIKECIHTLLSEMEQRIFSLYLKGLPYEEIANRVGRDKKSVGNALQRARRKMEQYKKGLLEILQ